MTARSLLGLATLATATLVVGTACSSSWSQEVEQGASVDLRAADTDWFGLELTLTAEEDEDLPCALLQYRVEVAFDAAATGSGTLVAETEAGMADPVPFDLAEDEPAPLTVLSFATWEGEGRRCTASAGLAIVADDDVQGSLTIRVIAEDTSSGLDDEPEGDTELSLQLVQAG